MQKIHENSIRSNSSRNNHTLETRATRAKYIPRQTAQAKNILKNPEIYFKKTLKNYIH